MFIGIEEFIHWALGNSRTKTGTLRFCGGEEGQVSQTYMSSLSAMPIILVQPNPCMIVRPDPRPDRGKDNNGNKQQRLEVIKEELKGRSE